jgi:N-acetyl-gamma-glutamyl-phosphate reductase
VATVGIVGGTGYTGVELLRLLACHPDVDISVITSRSEKGLAVADLYPNLRGHVDLAFEEPDADRLAECDMVFFATPHGVAQSMMPELMKRDTRVVDLSADFRIRDIAVWEKWYKQKHQCPELVADAVYGLPEFRRDAIAGAKLVAAPGCYSTAVELGFLPLLQQGVVETNSLVASCASGVSGAGRQANIDNLFSEMGESFKAYGVAGHRHLPEIEQELSLMANQSVSLTFVPHLLPVVRGIHATLFATLNDTGVDVQGIYEQRYGNETFVDVLPAGSHPQTRTVRGTNNCQIAVHRTPKPDTVVVLVAEDNLTKGASGQAIQCMNIMLGFAEDAGLTAPAILP